MQRRDKESEKSLANVIMCLRKIGLMAKGKSQMQVVLMDHRLQICMHSHLDMGRKLTLMYPYLQWVNLG